jgi:outer membrane protein assembly factor BamB
MTSNWPTFMRDQQRTGYCPDVFRPPLELAWKKQLGSYICGSAIIVDQKVMVSQDYLYAFDLQTGELVWRSDQPVNSYKGGVGAPLFWQDTAWTSGETGLYQFDLATGKQLGHWPYGSIGISLTASQDQLFWAAQDHSLYLLDSNSGTVEAFETDPYLNTVLTSDSERVYGFCRRHPDRRLVAWNSQSKEWIWQRAFDIDDGIVIGHASVYESIIYLCQSKAGLQAFYAHNRKPLWRFGSGLQVQTSPCVSPSHVYVAGQGMYALERTTGTLVWKNEDKPEWKRSRFYASAPICIGSTLYIGGGMNRAVYAFDATSGALIWEYKTDAMLSSTPAYANGHLVIGAHDGYLYCFRQAHP